jgi:hypothetical protein
MCHQGQSFDTYAPGSTSCGTCILNPTDHMISTYRIFLRRSTSVHTSYLAGDSHTLPHCFLHPR